MKYLITKLHNRELLLGEEINKIGFLSYHFDGGTNERIEKLEQDIRDFKDLIRTKIIERNLSAQQIRELNAFYRTL